MGLGEARNVQESSNLVCLHNFGLFFLYKAQLLLAQSEGAVDFVTRIQKLAYKKPELSQRAQTGTVCISLYYDLKLKWEASTPWQGWTCQGPVIITE